MKNYIYVAVMTGVITVSLYAYKSCQKVSSNANGGESFIGGLLTKPSGNVKKIPKPHTQVDTTTTTVSKPDGTVVTTVVDHSIISPKRNNKASVGVVTEDAKKVKYYEFRYERRVLENVWVGGLITSDKAFGVSVGVEF